MRHGKYICDQLKEVRKRIAEENDIPLKMEDCTHNGECQGSCPRCEAEVRYLENALAERLRIGKVATVAGLALGLAATAHAQAPEKPNAIPDSTTRYEDMLEGEIFDPDIFIFVDEEPEFPGGIEAMRKFINDNMQYPILAAENGIGGKVVISIVIDSDGTVQNPRILREIGGGCGSETLRIIKFRPKWKPVKQKGKAVRVNYTLPVLFDIEKNHIPIIEGQAPIQIEGMPAGGPWDNIGPNSSTQEMEKDGVKLIVR